MTKNPHLLTVNQKLAFARIQLKATALSLSEADIETRLAVHAHLDAAVQQLYDAVLYFVREIAIEANFPSLPDTDDVNILLAELSAQGHSVAEIGEIARLSKQPNSWLFDLLAARRDPQFVLRQFSDAGGDQSLSATTSAKSPSLDTIPLHTIPLHTVDRESKPGEQLLSWLQSLQELIERHRQSLVEE